MSDLLCNRHTKPLRFKGQKDLESLLSSSAPKLGFQASRRSVSLPKAWPAHRSSVWASAKLHPLFSAVTALFTEDCCAPGSPLEASCQSEAWGGGGLQKLEGVHGHYSTFYREARASGS